MWSSPIFLNGWHGEFNQGSQISGKHGTHISTINMLSHEKNILLSIVLIG